MYLFLLSFCIAMSHAHSFRNYRNHLHTLNPPCVPYVGVYLTDLTFLEDGNPDLIEGLISWSKRAKIAEVFSFSSFFESFFYLFLSFSSSFSLSFR
jgi:son of sevenless